MQNKLKAKALSWNKVILEAMSVCKYFNIDKLFISCENKLRKLNAPEKEIALRMLALAFYCDRTYNGKFSKSAAFSRFAEIMDFAHFEQTIKRLLKKEDPALVIFWAIFRLSFGNSIMQKRYLAIEKKMRFSILPSL
ncbi:MAG: hypothetical protein FWC26_03555 [Fibromonadales bacterium]|nr:hypothetical protein [Fibromonadales bacterium]